MLLCKGSSKFSPSSGPPRGLDSTSSDDSSRTRPTPSLTLSGADSSPARTIERVEHCLKYYNADHSDRLHDNSLDCTFCGKLFPIFYLLSTSPDGLDDWRGVHYRYCYQCATCANDDYIWYSECSILAPAKLAERGNLGFEPTTTPIVPASLTATTMLTRSRRAGTLPSRPPTATLGR